MELILPQKEKRLSELSLAITTSESKIGELSEGDHWWIKLHWYVSIIGGVWALCFAVTSSIEKVAFQAFAAGAFFLPMGTYFLLVQSSTVRKAKAEKILAVSCGLKQELESVMAEVKVLRVERHERDRQLQQKRASEKREKEAALSEKRRTLKYWLGLDGHVFEREFAALLAQLGWKTKVTRASGDGGIDIVATAPDGRRAAIQCKRWQGRVGAPAVRDLKGATFSDDFQLAIVIGTGGFTKEARDFAKTANVILWDDQQLLKLIGAANKLSEQTSFTQKNQEEREEAAKNI